MAIPTPYVASLRVYEPIENFPETSRFLWEKSFKSEDSKEVEQVNSLLRMILAMGPDGQIDGAHIIEIDGKKFAAPWTTSKRFISALIEFKSSLPSSVSKFFLPRNLDDSKDSFGNDILNRAPQILTATWTIPPRWFALFAPEERLANKNSPYPIILFRTKLELAIARGLRAHRAVLKAFGPGVIEEELAELVNWLNIFDPSSFLELDYGGLAVYLRATSSGINNGGIEKDTSVEDVQTSIAGLESGDASLAGIGYERLMNRWHRVSEFERAN